MEVVYQFDWHRPTQWGWACRSSIGRGQEDLPSGDGLADFPKGVGKQTYLVGFRAYPTHPYQFERRPRNGNGYTDLHSGVGDLPSWNQGLQTYPMGIRACRLHSGDGHADLSHGAVGSTQWRRACKSSEGGGGGGVARPDLPCLFPFFLFTITTALFVQRSLWVRSLNTALA